MINKYQKSIIKYILSHKNKAVKVYDTGTAMKIQIDDIHYILVDYSVANSIYSSMYTTNDYPKEGRDPIWTVWRIRCKKIVIPKEIPSPSRKFFSSRTPVKETIHDRDVAFIDKNDIQKDDLIKLDKWVNEVMELDALRIKALEAERKQSQIKEFWDEIKKTCKLTMEDEQW